MCSVSGSTILLYLHGEDVFTVQIIEIQDVIKQRCPSQNAFIVVLLPNLFKETTLQ